MKPYIADVSDKPFRKKGLNTSCRSSRETRIFQALLILRFRLCSFDQLSTMWFNNSKQRADVTLACDDDQINKDLIQFS